MSHPINILMVDDRPENLLALEAVLSCPNYRLISADSGQSALKWVLKEDFAVILLDVQMPELSGLETAKLIRTREKSQHTPIIFITASQPDTQAVQTAYALGAIDYILKPVDPDILRHKIAGFAHLHQHKEQLELVVKERTRELQMVNEKLRLEIEQRKSTDRELRHYREQLEKLVEERTLELRMANEMLLDALAQKEQAQREILQLNAGLQRRAIELDVANKELQSFSYSVSHDLRSPLRSIDGFSLALLEEYEAVLDETGQDYLRRVRTATQRMGHLIDDLLNLSRVTRQDLVYQAVNLSKIAQTKLQELQQSDPQRQVTTRVTEGLVVQGDKRLLTLALENLLDNAWKFTSERGRAVIEMGLQEREGEQVYYVKDNGAGFHMDYAHKLFVPFQRLHAMDQFPGTGIGLATVKRVIQRHGGQIWPEASVNEGVTFYFTLGNCMVEE